MAMKPLANRGNIVKPSAGNTGVRFQDSTAKVAGILTGGARPQVSGKRGGCSSCGR